MFKYSLIELKWLMSKLGILSEVYDIRVFMSFREKIWNLDNLEVLEKKCTKGYFGKFAP